MSSLTTSTASLLVGFLGVCNESLAKNRDTFPYKHVFGLYEKLFADRDVHVTIYEDDPGKEIGPVTIRYVDGRYEPVSGESQSPGFRVKLKRSYMEQVVANPEQYIEHPEKLDWDWLKSRIGFDNNDEPATVEDVMTPQLWPVRHDASIEQASEMMRDLDVGALPVVDGRTVIGIVTDRDITIRSTAKGDNPRSTMVRDVMTPEIGTCPKEIDVQQAAETMRTLRVRRLVVLDGSEHPVGMVSVGDIALRSPEKSLAGSVLAEINSAAAS
jgi:CBS domain-containing protein